MSRSTEERLDRVERTLQELVHAAELLKTVLIVKEPQSTVAAGAFDGLRKQIVAVAQEHWAHLAQVAQMDAAISHVSEVAELRTISNQWLEQAGVRKVDLPTTAELAAEQFELVGQGAYVVEALRPAYVDVQTGRVIKQGLLRLAESRPTTPKEEPNPTEVPSTGDAGSADKEEEAE